MLQQNRRHLGDKNRKAMPINVGAGPKPAKIKYVLNRLSLEYLSQRQPGKLRAGLEETSLFPLTGPGNLHNLLAFQGY